MKLNRRKFIKASAAGALAAGSAAILANYDFLIHGLDPNDAKKIFTKCGTCSQTYFYILNREFGYPKKAEELASDTLAGGLMGLQYQCGMLWGSVLAVGAESYRRYQDSSQAINVAVLTSQSILASFNKRAKTISCKEITCDFSNKAKLAKFGLESIPGGFSNLICMNLAEKWYHEAIQAARNGLNSSPEHIPAECLSCASEVAKRMGANNEEITVVSGLAGGMGLSGNACGALGAAIWISALQFNKANPDKSTHLNPKPAKMLEVFKEETDSEFLCSKICEQKFATIQEHTNYLANGGCNSLINALAQA